MSLPGVLPTTGLRCCFVLKKTETGIAIAQSHPAETDKPPAQFANEKGSRTIYMEFKRPVIASSDSDEQVDSATNSISAPEAGNANGLSFGDIKGVWLPVKAIQGGTEKPKEYRQVVWNFADPHTLVIQYAAKDRKRGASERCILNVDFTTCPVTFRYLPASVGFAICGIIKKTEAGITVAVSHPAETDKPPAKFVSEAGTRTTYMEFKRPVIAPSN